MKTDKLPIPLYVTLTIPLRLPFALFAGLIIGTLTAINFAYNIVFCPNWIGSRAYDKPWREAEGWLFLKDIAYWLMVACSWASYSIAQEKYHRKL